jgi:hypothetical protein
MGRAMTRYTELAKLWACLYLGVGGFTRRGGVLACIHTVQYPCIFV